MTENIGKNLENEATRFRQILANDPSSKAFAQLAETYRKLGRLKEAAKVCQEGLAKHPEFSGASLLLGRIFMEMDQLQEAEKELVKLLKRVPNHLNAHQILARVYLRLGKADHAKAIAKRIAKMSPDDPTAQAILNNGRKAATVAKKQPALPTATMAKLYEQQGHLQKALEIYRQLANTDPAMNSEVERMETKLANQAKVAKLNKFLHQIKSHQVEK